MLDESSNKNQTKWKKTEPFNLEFLNKTPKWIKYLVIAAIIPLVLAILRRLRTR